MGDGIAIGQVLAERYEISGVLGEGSMGLVYDAVHKALGRSVAVKTLRADLAGETELVKRFQMEARAAGALGHRNIVQVMDAGQLASGLHFLVMERIDGGSLEDELEKSPSGLPLDRSISIVAGVLSGLAAAHKQGIIHRDLKPANILLGRDDDGTELAKIADFGISKILDPKRLGTGGSLDLKATEFGQLMGTPYYMAPEQARGETDIDPRADLWAAGCVLYELLCGRPPFLGDNYTQILSELLTASPPAPGTLSAVVTPAVEKVLLQALSKNRDDRPADATTLRDMLTNAAVQPAAKPVKVRGTDSTSPPPQAQGILAGAGTGTGNAADEEALMAALNRAVNSELADGAPPEVPGGTGDPPAAEAKAPEPPAPASAHLSVDMDLVSPPASGPASADMFAPPDDQEAMMSLEVDLPSRPSASVTVASAPTHSAPRAAVSASTTMSTARRPGIGLRGGFMWLLLLAILAGGGFAGYRYFTLGYVLKKPPMPDLTVAVSVVPERAEMLVDGAVVSDHSLVSKVGIDRELLLRAPGRLTVRRTIRRKSVRRTLAIRLPTALSPIDGAASEIAVVLTTEDPAKNLADVDSALRRMNRYGYCLDRLAAAVRQSEAEYLSSWKKKSSRRSPAITPLPASEVQQCRQSVESGGAMAKVAGVVDAAAMAYAVSLVKLEQRVRKTAKYYESGEATKDRGRWGRDSHELLVSAYREAVKNAQVLVAATDRKITVLQARELELLSAVEPDSPHLRLRAVGVTARQLAQLETTDHDESQCAPLRSDLDERVGRAVDAFASAPSMAASGMLAVAAERPAHAAEASAWISWFNQMIESFNRFEP